MDPLDHNHLAEIADLRAEVVSATRPNHDYTFKIITIGDHGALLPPNHTFRHWQDIFDETTDTG